MERRHMTGLELKLFIMQLLRAAWPTNSFLALVADLESIYKGAWLRNLGKYQLQVSTSVSWKQTPCLG